VSEAPGTLSVPGGSFGMSPPVPCGVRKALKMPPRFGLSCGLLLFNLDNCSMKQLCPP